MEESNETDEACRHRLLTEPAPLPNSLVHGDPDVSHSGKDRSGELNPALPLQRDDEMTDTAVYPDGNSLELNASSSIAHVLEGNRDMETSALKRNEKVAFDICETASMCSLDVSRLDVYSLSNYSFGRKETESKSQEARGVSGEDIARHRSLRFKERGLRRTVAAVALVHQHRFPHVLLLQRISGHGGYVLPGGRLRPGETAEDGLRRKLTAKLSPAGAETENPSWEIGEECMCN